MDALSTLLQQAQHLSQTKYYHLHIAGDWGYSLINEQTLCLYLVESGSFFINTADSSRQVYAGDIVMLPHAKGHVCHTLGHQTNTTKVLDEFLSDYDKGVIDSTKDSAKNSTEKARFLLVECQYDQQTIQPLLAVLPAILPEQGTISKIQFRALDQAFISLTLESEPERLGQLAMVNLWASMVMVECLRTYIETLSETTDSWLAAIRHPYLAKALAMMHGKPNYSWTTCELAKAVGMSRSSFTQRFKDKVGVPPLTYLIQYRLRIAAHHLRLPYYNIGQIGTLVGYSSNSTFSQAFKRAYDMSPRQYRQRYQNLSTK